MWTIASCLKNQFHKRFCFGSFPHGSREVPRTFSSRCNPLSRYRVRKMALCHPSDCHAEETAIFPLHEIVTCRPKLGSVHLSSRNWNRNLPSQSTRPEGLGYRFGSRLQSPASQRGFFVRYRSNCFPLGARRQRGGKSPPRIAPCFEASVQESAHFLPILCSMRQSRLLGSSRRATNATLEVAMRNAALGIRPGLRTIRLS